MTDSAAALTTPTHTRGAILAGLIVGVVAAGAAALWRGSAGDLGGARCLAQAILAGQSLYTACPPSAGLPQDTVFAGVLMLPFVWMSDALVGAVWIGITSGLLAWALTRRGAYWRLLLFVTPAYGMTLWNMQAGCFLCLIALFPDALPFALYKPPQGLVIGLWRFSWRRAISSAAVLLISILIWPSWLLDWARQATSYTSVIPLLVLPIGPLLVLALCWWRIDRARLLILMSCVPQRGMYNALLLYLMPETLHEMTIAVVAGWLGVVLWLMVNSEAIGLVAGCYLPMLLLLYMRRKTGEQPVNARSLIVK